MVHHGHRRLTICQRLLTLAFLVLVAGSLHAQQPFVTDDADVTPRGKFNLQIGNEFDILQRSEYPALRQNTLGFEINYGVLKNVEVGFNVPLLGIASSRLVSPSTVFGMGDSTLHVKYNFYRERPKSRLPAMAITGLIQFHTGDPSRDLGSGLTDYYINGILQKTVTVNTTFRLNGGILFSGSNASGELGIKVRGRVFTAGGSLVKQITKRFDLGAELAGAVPGNFDLTKGQLQALVGGNYFVRKNMTLDFGLVGGHFPASPRVGVVLGLTMEF